MIKLELTENETKLLLMILEEAWDDRANMGCNDADEQEEKLFSQEERIEIQRKMYGDNFDWENYDGQLGNMEYVTIIKDKIESQLPKSLLDEI